MTDPAVTVRDLVLDRGSRRVLAGVTFDVRSKEVVALMGQSGSGKTTILRAIAGLEVFDGGSIAIDGVTLSGGSPSREAIARLRQRIGMVFQFHCLFEHLTVIENVCLAPIHVHREAAASAAERAHDLLERLGVNHRARALPRELSGGEAQRVAIARALAVDPPILLLDEPTASLDPARRTELADLLGDLIGRSRTLIVATHDEEFARRVATRILHVANGVVRDDGL